jgi:hypothetical protein
MQKSLAQTSVAMGDAVVLLGQFHFEFLACNC